LKAYFALFEGRSEWRVAHCLLRGRLKSEPEFRLPFPISPPSPALETSHQSGHLVCNPPNPKGAIPRLRLPSDSGRVEPHKAMIPWSTSRQTNDEGYSWTESRFIENSLRCCRVGRFHYTVSHGQDWRTNRPSKIAKFEFRRGPTLDLAIGSGKPDDVRRTLAFAFRCVLESDAPPPTDGPLFSIYPKVLKHLICNIRYYEASHPTFGPRFAGKNPPLTIDDLVEMITDALAQKSIRIPAKALRFDPRD
jgi:hypothetical protein